MIQNMLIYWPWGELVFIWYINGEMSQRAEHWNAAEKGLAPNTTSGLPVGPFQIVIFTTYLITVPPSTVHIQNAVLPCDLSNWQPGIHCSAMLVFIRIYRLSKTFNLHGGAPGCRYHIFWHLNAIVDSRHITESSLCIIADSLGPKWLYVQVPALYGVYLWLCSMVLLWILVLHNM